MTILRNLVTHPLGADAPLTTTGWRGSDPLAAVLIDGQPAIEAVQGADGSSLYVDPDINFTAAVGDTIRLDLDVQADYGPVAEAMQLRIRGYGGGGADIVLTELQPIPEDQWRRLSAQAVVTAAPDGHYFRTLVWPFTGEMPSGVAIRVRRAVVQIGTTVATDGGYRDGDSAGWAWDGTPHASTSSGPLQPYTPDGQVVDVAGARLDWLDQLDGWESEAETGVRVTPLHSAVVLDHYVTRGAAGPRTGRLLLRFTRELGTGTPGVRSLLVDRELRAGEQLRFEFTGAEGLESLTIVPTGRVRRWLEPDARRRGERGVWCVEFDWTEVA